MIKEGLTGIVLAGGLSSRMGSDKGLLPYKGKLLVEYAIDTLKLYCNEIIISTNNSEYHKLGYPLVEDIYKGKGPLGGIHAGLMAAKTEFNLFLSCDMPHINPEAMALIIEQLTPNAYGFIPIYGDKLEPMFGIYSKQLIPEIEKRLQSEKLKMRQLIYEQKLQTIDFLPLIQKHKDLFSNMNSPNDLVK